jgi:hypothetical protein
MSWRCVTCVSQELMCNFVSDVAGLKRILNISSIDNCTEALTKQCEVSMCRNTDISITVVNEDYPVNKLRKYKTHFRWRCDIGLQIRHTRCWRFFILTNIAIFIFMFSVLGRVLNVFTYTWQWVVNERWRDDGMLGQNKGVGCYLIRDNQVVEENW